MNSEENPEPFRIEVSGPKIYEDTDLYLAEDYTSSTDAICRRISFRVTIDNISNQDYKDVWFELSLNKEAEPYIASHILTYASEKMDITTSEKSQVQNDSNKAPIISGFEHTWEMLLTTEDDLSEYYMLEPEGLKESLKSITINVHWDGGNQNITKNITDFTM